MLLILSDLKSGQPAVVPYSINWKIKIETQYPVVKVLLKSRCSILCKGNKLKRVSLRKPIYVFTLPELKPLLYKKRCFGAWCLRPFLPSGKPVVVPTLYREQRGVFEKLSSVTININWKACQLITAAFESHYHNYISSGNAGKSENFKVNISIPWWQGMVSLARRRKWRRTTVWRLSAWKNG